MFLRFTSVQPTNPSHLCLTRRSAHLARSIIFAVVLCGTTVVGSAVAHAEGPKASCPEATATTVECLSFAITGEIEPFGGSGEKGGFSPSDLRSAYKLPTTGGSGQTVAIVDAFNDPNAESDLKTYRSHYGLSECTKANGCFKKVNQAGEEANYPANNVGWSIEMSLDLDMVSAVCPECHIVLVEATTNSFENMDAAENKAAALTGTTEISDSWGAPETSNRTSEDSYFNHPGIPILVSSGDYCYRNECRGYKAPNWPSTSKYVVSVGGTKLETAVNSRGWKERVWYEAARAIGTGSGCSIYESKPSWETDKSCANRTDTDVSAVGACESPLSIYDSYEQEGWFNECGTSASAPILAGVEALSSKSVREMGAEAFWKAGPAGNLFDVTEGTNWYSSTCGNYLCEGKTGYDGPTGWGTPNGAITVGPTWQITPAVNPTEAQNSYFWGVSCTSSTTCVAVGEWNRNNSAFYNLLAEKWNGTEWTLQSVPMPPEENSGNLESVSCSTSTTCMAAGYYKNSSGKSFVLTESWNGTEWSLVSAPEPAETLNSRLAGISCPSSSACTAVGDYETTSGVKKPLVERWNGTSWSIQTAPSPTGAKSTSPLSVSCATTAACTLAGEYTNSSAVRVPLAEGWNGTEWSVQSIGAQAEATVSWLRDVSCSAASACTVVGTYGVSSGVEKGFAERWNGKSWTIQTTTLPPESKDYYLDGVSCVSATVCTGVGVNLTTGSKYTTLAERWNGTSWIVQSTPNNVEGQGWLSGEVSCTSETECMGVGNTGKALAEVYR